MNDLSGYSELAPAIGVYLLLMDNVVVYVGQSRNVHVRLSEHTHRLRGKYNRVLVRLCTEDKLCEYESKALARFKPILNTQMVAPTFNTLPVDTAKIDLKALGIGKRKAWEGEDGRRCKV